MHLLALLLASIQLLLASTTVVHAEPREFVPAQLNIPGFAYCLGHESPELNLEIIQKHYRFDDSDLLLLYLSVYPGKRIPVLNAALQKPAHSRWATAFESLERDLAGRFLGMLGPSDESVTPSRFFREALQSCRGDVFCASLISHNVLRTLGRHEQAVHRGLLGRRHDFNPQWFLSERAAWLARIPRLREALIPLRTDGQGDRWGEWYHFFGILTYVLHEQAMQHGMGAAELVVRLNELLNPILAGDQEDPQKARLDRDSVRVAWYFTHSEELTPFEVWGPWGSCDLRSSYVELAL